MSLGTSEQTMTDMDITAQIMAYEAGELDWDEVVELFQALVDNGMAWQLQGSYGRMAQALIEEGAVIWKD